MSSRSDVDISRHLPLFVFPTSLSFYTDDTASHQQILTVYNPYSFSLKYKVLSTAPRKYRVIDSEGVIKPHCCMDIFIRHREVCCTNEGVRDKFRLHVSEFGQKTIIGRKDVVSVLLATREQQHDRDDTFESLPPSSMTSSSPLSDVTSQRKGVMASGGGAVSVSGPSWVVLVTAVLCIVVLMLPVDVERPDDVSRQSSVVPQYIRVSVHQKLIAAYILGLVTMVVLRS